MRIILGLALFSLIAACGGDDDDGLPTTTNPQSARSTVDQTANLGDQLDMAEGFGAAGAVQAIGGSAQGIVTLDPGAAQRIEQTPGGNAMGTCDCDASGCTYTDCGDDAGAWTMNGTISISGDTTDIDLMMVTNSAGLMYTWDYDGSITITDTMISGSLSGDGAVSTMGVDIDWSWDVDYNDVELDAQKCPIGGSVDASVSYSTGSEGDFSGSGTVTFGPSCGDAM